MSAIRLIRNDTDAEIGTATEAQLRFLVGELEEEDSADTDYWIDADTIEFLRDEGADPALLEILRSAIAGTDGVEIRWEKI